MGASNFGDYQLGVYMQGMMGVKPELPLDVKELEAQAKEKMDPRAYWYVAGGGGAEDTVDENRAAFNRWRIVPRMLRDVKERDHQVEVLGAKMKAPLMLAPIGVQEIVHPEAELAVARAAASVGVPMMLSTLASNPLEKVAEASGDNTRWFQLYWPGADDVTLSLIKRAEAAGYSAIVVTLDTRLMGWRSHDLQEAYLPFLEAKGLANYFSDPAFRAGLDETPEENPQAAVGRWAEIYADNAQHWESLKLIQDNTSLPILLKGILHPEDARKAKEMGIDGIVVSNHGGRQVGGSISSLAALPAIVDAVGPEYPVLLDSGIRHGEDIVKALALGAKSVLLGRPYVWGLALQGEEGVRTVVQRMLAEYDLCMALCGFRTPGELSPGILYANRFSA